MVRSDVHADDASRHILSFADVKAVLATWVEDELAYWSAQNDLGRDFDDEYNRLNNEAETIFIVDIVADQVSMRPKLGMHDLVGGHVKQETHRISLYVSYIQEALSRFKPGISLTLAIDVHDISFTHSTAPIFTFQKSCSSPLILLPDIDFMLWNWYEDKAEELAFECKASKAVFVGASTGGHITAADVLEPKLERLRLASDAVNNDSVDIWIGAAVQCDSVATEDLLRQQPYFSGHIPWSEQLTYKMIISIDGNGATCSRVYLALRSRSLLLKHASKERLYYFSGMKPWRHFVPVNSVDEISRVVQAEAEGRLNANSIIDEANSFARNFLNREAVCLYGAMLLSKYAELVGLSQRSRSKSLLVGVEAHLGEVGDVAVGPGEWLGGRGCVRLEGVRLVPRDDVPSEAAWYRCIPVTQQRVSFVPLGSFSGTTGQSEAVSQIDVCVDPRYRGSMSFTGMVEFSDGFVATIPPLEGSVRRDGAIVVGLRLNMVSVSSAMPESGATLNAG